MLSESRLAALHFPTWRASLYIEIVEIGDERSCQAVYAPSNTQIRSMLLALFEGIDMVHRMVTLCWCMTWVSTSINDLHDPPTLKGNHSSRLRPSVNGVTLWQPAQIFFSMSIQHHLGRNVLFLKKPHDGRIQTPNTVLLFWLPAHFDEHTNSWRSQMKKKWVIHNTSSWTKAEPLCSISASHSIKSSLFWPRHFFLFNQHC